MNALSPRYRQAEGLKTLFVSLAVPFHDCLRVARTKKQTRKNEFSDRVSELIVYKTGTISLVGRCENYKRHVANRNVKCCWQMISSTNYFLTFSLPFAFSKVQLLPRIFE